MKNDMYVDAELLENGELKLVLGGMDWQSKLKMIKRILFKNNLKVYLTRPTVQDLKELLARGYRA